MKKLVLLFFLFLLLILPSAPIVRAQDAGMAVPPEKMIFPYPGDQLPNIFGQEHNYSVTFRGNGEAVVTARVAFSNQEDTSLSELPLRVPKVNPQDIIAFQVIRESTCVRYEPVPLLERGKAYQQICAQYQEPDYFQYGYGNAKYQKAPTELRSDTIVVKLPKPIKPSGSGSVLLYYRAVGYAKKNTFGAWNFNYETLKVEDKVNKLQVGVTVDDDLALAGTKGKVNYRFDEAATAAVESLKVAGAAPSEQMDSFYQQVGQGQIVKTASNLQPLDSYTVKGTYADSRLKLYGKHIAVGVLFTGIVLFLLVLAVKRLLRFVLTHKGKSTVSQTMATDVVGVFGLSFAASFMIVAYTVGLFVARNLMSPLLYSEFSIIFTILTLVVSLGIYGLLLISPALLVGVRKGMSWGLATFGMTVVWLVIDSVVTLLVVWMLAGYNREIPVPYFMEQMMGSGASGARSTDIQMIEPQESNVSPVYPSTDTTPSSPEQERM